MEFRMVIITVLSEVISSIVSAIAVFTFVVVTVPMFGCMFASAALAAGWQVHYMISC